MDHMIVNEDRRFQDLTYYDRACTADDITATSADDLLITPNHTAHDAKVHMMHHGMSIYPNLLKAQTAKELRKFILQRNAQLRQHEVINVINNDNRWSFGIGANEHPIVPKALHEIATHSQLRPAIELIAGRNPAVIEFTAITVAPGASAQYWHFDSESSGSALMWSRTFIPSYSLFIPLQDTTAEMGATAVCPGSHMCVTDQHHVCEPHGFQASSLSETGYWPRGAGLLMNQQSFHRGGAFTDMKAPTRVLFILTFAPRPIRRMETRQLGQGGSYSTRWDMWGHTMNDIADAPNAMAQPWAALRSLGLYKKSSSSDWGWDYVSQISQRVTNSDSNFGEEDWEDFVENGLLMGPLGLPSWLQGNVPDEDDEEGQNDRPFLEFWIDTLYTWEATFGLMNAMVIGVYLLLVLIITGIQSCFRTTTTSSSSKHQRPLLVRVLIRLFVTHGIIAFLAWMLIRHVHGTYWAKDIVSGKRLSSPFSTRIASTNLYDDTASDDAEIVDIPFRDDVLFGNRFGTRFLASYNEMLDYHPGNQAWNSEVSFLSSSSSSSTTKTTKVGVLSPSMRQAIAQTLLRTMYNYPRRILIQNSIADWTIMPYSRALEHAQYDLLLYQNTKNKKSFLQILDMELNFLLTDYRDGYMRDMIMAYKWSISNIQFWKRKLILDRLIITKNNEYLNTMKKKKKESHPIRLLSDREQEQKKEQEEEQPNFFLDQLGTYLEPLPDFRGAPIRSATRIVMDLSNGYDNNDDDDEEDDDGDSYVPQVGDIVEGQFNGVHNEWYKGIVQVKRSDGLYDILYDDGDLDEGLPKSSVRPYIPPVVGEIIFMRIDDENWERGAIVSRKTQNNDDDDNDDDNNNSSKKQYLFEVTIERGKTYSNITPDRIRRFSWNYQVNDPVKCQFRDTGYWYNGVIAKVRLDGKYDIRYDDGDWEYGLDKHEFKFAFEP